MKVYVPRQLAWIKTPKASFTDRITGLSPCCHFLPIDCTSEDVPSFFIEKRRGYQNDVSHAKLIGTGGFPYSTVETSFKDWSTVYHCLNNTFIDGNRCYLFTSQVNVYRSYALTIHFSQTDVAFELCVFDSWYNGQHKQCYVNRVSNQVFITTHDKRWAWEYGPGVGGRYWTPNAQEIGDSVPDNMSRLTYEDRLAVASRIYSFLDPYLNDMALCCKFDRTYRMECNVYLPYIWKVPDTRTLNASRFLFHESERLDWYWDPIIAGKDTEFSNYWRNWLIQHAYLDALESLPRLNENSISNIIELVSFIKSLVLDHQIEIPKSLQSSWLSYRYQYTTSSLDAKEAIEFVHRHMDLGSLDKGITCYGRSFTNYKGSDVTCRCRVDVIPRELSTLASIWRSLYTYGLQPDFYVIWDMIPYSFIVDWFIPIGDMASVLDAERMYRPGVNYDFKDIVFSLSYDRDFDGYTTHQYTRWLQGSPPELNGLYWFDKEPVSKKVFTYRCLDAASLLIKSH